MAAQISSQFPHTPDYCEQRGFHGPFLRAEVYDRYPGWQGIGDCATCGSTRMRGLPLRLPGRPTPVALQA